MSTVKGIPLKEVSSGTDSYSHTYGNTQDNIAAASSGQTWTVSVYALAAAGTNIQVWIFGANSSGNYVELALNGYGVTATGQWQRISVTMTFSNGSTAFVQARVATSTNGATVWWDGLQVEQKSNPTQFTVGTRSTTQGLLDLTGNSTINLSNVSFDSNAQIVFDGTDDVITATMTNLRPTTSITQEVVVYIDNNSIQIFIGSQYGSSSGNSYALWLDSANNLAAGVNIGGTLNYQLQSYTITINKWYHFIHTYDGATQKLYANGQLIRSWSTSGNIAYDSNNTLLAIGNDWNGSGYNVGAPYAVHGKQSITRLYNRALSATEVNQNYNKYKSRFNLS